MIKRGPKIKRKNFSHVKEKIDIKLNPLVSIGMYKKIKKHTNNISDYIRILIMNDLKIDEFGNERK